PTRASTRVATVLIIGASRGIGLETVKAALEAGHFGSCPGAVGPKNTCQSPQTRKNGRRRARSGYGETRADRHRCPPPGAWCFGRAQNHLRADEAFLEGDPSARHRDAGSSNQAIDLRNGLRGGRQPRQWGVSL